MKKKLRNERKPTATRNLPRDQRESTDIAKTYEATPDEHAAIKTVLARRVKAPRLKVTETDGRTELSLDHPNTNYGVALLMQVFATGEVEFHAEIISQLGKASVQDGKANERELNFMLAVIKGIQPRDQLETMLAAQMACVHSLTMDMAGRLKGSFTLDQQDVTERALNKLARTFATQLEALKRYRSNGEQKVTVEHVTVNEGGKAIVGNVAHGGQGGSKKPETTS
jgi:hypothetical protein